MANNAARNAAVQAPIGGWNTRDALDDMPPEDAVLLDNWVPYFGSCAVRNGYTAFCSGLGGAVKTLIELNAGDYRWFIACANNKAWHITSGTATDITGSSTITNSKWQWAQFDDASGGARIAMVNGNDAPLALYPSGGTPVLSPLTVSGSGLTGADLDGVCVHKSRSYFWDTTTQDFWYSATNALGGSLTKFPLGRVTGTGGNIVAMASWTVDGGDGVDDLAVFLLNSGDVFVYGGDDPGANWALIGRYKIGAPLTVRGLAQYGGDLVVITKDGYIPMSANFISARAKVQAFSDKITPTVVGAIADNPTDSRWEIVVYPAGLKLIVNVPVSTNVVHQHVMNTRTGAWCRYTGINAQTWGMYSDALYFGGPDGVVYRAETGATDNGASITGDGIPAWNYFGARNRLKHWTAVQPVLRSNGSSLTYGVALRTDFDPALKPAGQGTASASTTAWGAAWGSAWAVGEQVFRDWRGAAGIGYNAGVRLTVSPAANQTVEWLSTNYLYKPGGLV